MDQQSKLALKQKLQGILPPVTMPFDKSGKLVLNGIKGQIDFMIESGANAIVAGGSTGEGHTLSTEEFVEAMEATNEAIAGRVPLVAGLIVNSTREAIDRTNKIAHLKPEALQVTPVHYLFKPGAEATIKHFRDIYAENNVPILIYNVIPWNYLSTELMLQIMDEVPGVAGMKQSSGDLKSLSDLVQSSKKENIVLTGIDALLYPGFALGANGAISALTSAVPKATFDLWNAVKNGDHEKALDLHWKLNSLWNATRHENLPACTKYIQSRQGLEFFHPRAPMEAVSEELKKGIDAALKGLGI